MAGNIYDVIIIGGGPAGLTAGIYTSRARLNTLLLENYEPASQAVLTDWIENYPGFPDGINGFELIDKFKSQGKKFGLEAKIERVTGIEKAVNGWKVLAGGNYYEAISIIISTGASPKKLNIPGESRFIGKGVSFCATCDGALYKGREIAVVGGGDTAIEEALFLSKFAKKITMIHRRDRLRAIKILQERAFANKTIEFSLDSVAVEVIGGDKVSGIRIKNVKTQAETVVKCEGVFIFVGLIPNTGYCEGVISRDHNGYIIVNQKMETSQKGIFACGDCTQKTLRQVVTAAGDGAVAAFACQQYIDEVKGTVY